MLGKVALVFVIACTIPLGSLFGQELPPPESIATVSGHLSYDTVHPGMDFDIAIVAKIMQGWHVNSSKPSDEALVGTSLVVRPPNSVSIIDVIYPEGAMKKFAFSEKRLSVYEGSITILAKASISANARPSEDTIRAQITYQACNDQLCLEPVTKTVVIPLKVTGLEVPVNQVSPEVFGGTAQVSRPSVPFESRGLLVTFLLIFIGGLALDLTPCIYPMIPITISYFGGQSRGSRKRLFGLAIAYVMGIAITYSVLGLVAALTGSLVGSAMQNPIVLAFVALVLVALALSMFDIYALNMPLRLSSFAGSPRTGIIGSLLMGLTLGVVVAPCVGPFVLGLLTYVGRLGRPLLGFWMFFVLAVGMGLPLMVLAILSGSIRSLPRSGEWMVWVKKIFGFILLLMAAYFLRTVIPHFLYWLILAAITLAAGLYIGWLKKVKGIGKVFTIARSALGVLILIAFVWILFAPGHALHGPRAGESIRWQPYDESAMTRSAEKGIPVVVDFTADWCVPCKELETKTFSDPRVVKRAARFTTLRVDLTKGASNELKALSAKYQVAGVPTVVFVGEDGKELPELKFVGFIGPDSLLGLMGKAFPKQQRKVGGN
jgi:thiol:disulfide interchange protein DsbD